MGFPRVTSNGALFPRAPGAFCVGASGTASGTARSRTTKNRPFFLLEVLAESRVGIGLASLIPVEASNGLRSLNVGVNSSLVESIEVFLPIPGPALGQVMADGPADGRLMVVMVRIKDVEQGRSNAD